MRLSLVHLSTLEAVTRLGTFAAAADELGYTPGAVSQQMDALGRAIGAPLFRRVGRVVELTDLGRVVAAKGPSLLAAERELLDEVANSGSVLSDRLRIGSWGSTAATLLPLVIDGMLAAEPGVELRSLEIDVDDAAEAVHLRRVDAAFGLQYPNSPMRKLPGVAMITLRRERFGIAVARADARSGRSVGLAELADDSWVLPADSTVFGRAMRAACRREGFEPNVAYEITDTAATLQLAGRGLGVAPVTDLMLELSPVAGVGRIDLREVVERELVLIAPEGYRHRRALVALIEVVRAAVPTAGAVGTAPAQRLTSPRRPPQ